MQHWSDQYIGLEYIPGAQDCAAFAVRVLREQLNKDVTLPTERGHGIREQSQQIMDLHADYATPTESPKEGDAVLMFARGHLSHIGVYVEIGGVPWVLHAMRNAGTVCRHRLRELGKLGLELGGFYKWK